MSRPYCPTHEVHGDPRYGRTWRVYYCYAADGACLYVGMTEDTRVRMEWHAFYSPAMVSWFPYCARVEETQPFDCRWDAHAFEVAEIGRLCPPFNKHHNRHPSPWTPGDDLIPLSPFVRRPITTVAVAPTDVKQTADELHHSMESLYGLCQHGERNALAPEARHAFRLMSRWLENALWPVAS